MIYFDLEATAKMFGEKIESSILWEERTYVKDASYKFEVGDTVVYVTSGQEVKVTSRHSTTDKRIYYGVKSEIYKIPEELLMEVNR